MNLSARVSPAGATAEERFAAAVTHEVAMLVTAKEMSESPVWRPAFLDAPLSTYPLTFGDEV